MQAPGGMLSARSTVPVANRNFGMLSIIVAVELEICLDLTYGRSRSIYLGELHRVATEKAFVPNGTGSSWNTHRACSRSSRFVFGLLNCSVKRFFRARRIILFIYLVLFSAC